MFIPLRAYDNYITANLVMQRLESENIQCYLQDENSVTIGPMFSNAIGGIKLMVHQEHLPRAQELLEAFEKEYREAAKCPKCGADNLQMITQTKDSANWLTAMVTWLFSNYAVSVKKVYKCFKCGYESEELPEQAAE